MPLAEGSSSPDEASTLTVEDTSTPPQDDDLSHGDYNRSTAGNEQQTTIGEEIPVNVPIVVTSDYSFILFKEPGQLFYLVAADQTVCLSFK